MIGRTNVGGGSQFSATLEVTTDPNAEITAVNLAGDTFSGTANASGLLTLNISKSGTYTVTETGGGVETIVIADNGATYQLAVNAFDGHIITEGVVVVGGGMSAEGYQTGTLTPLAPTITENATAYAHNAIMVSIANYSSGIYVTANEFDITDYSTLVYYCGTSASSGSPAIWAVDEDDNHYSLGYINAGSERSISISELDNTKKWRFGVMVYSTNYNTASALIIDLKLQ